MIDRAVRLARASSSTTSIVVLVLFNLVPLVGVLLWGWNIWTILVLYWAENGIVGLLNVPKMLLAQGPDDGTGGFRRTGGAAEAGRVGQVVFFLIHYGIFWFVHGIFVFALPTFAALGGSTLGGRLDIAPDPFGTALPASLDQTRPVVPDMSAVLFATIGLAVSHGVSFVVNFVGRREYERVSVARQMFAPYGRLVILHLTILLGVFVSLFLGTPVGAIVVLVVLKTALDLGLHLREHGRLAALGAPS